MGKAQFGIDPNQFKGEFSIGTSNDEGGEQRVTRDAQGRVIITSPQGTRTLNDTIGEKGKAAIATIMPLGTLDCGGIGMSRDGAP